MKILSTAKMRETYQCGLIEEFPEHQFTFYDQIEAVPAEAFAQAEVLVAYGQSVTAPILANMPKLQWIQALTAGIEMIPHQELKRRGILLTNVKGMHQIQMTEYTMGMILNLVRKSYVFHDQQKQAKWDKSVRIDEVYGKTLGILGFGIIGSEIAKRAKAFGMEVLAVRRRDGEKPDEVDELIPYAQREELFRRSDFLVVLLPMTAETVQFIGSRELELMKETAYLINIARGPVIDEAALLHSLQERQIAGAVLDVFNEEPLPTDNPLWRLDNVIITPHIAGSSPHYHQRALAIFRENLSNYPEQGKMRNIIDLDRGY